MDFGMSVRGMDNQTTLQIPVGTPNYMPPEMQKYKSYRPLKCDLYSAAICLFIMVSGRFPYRHADSFKCSLFKSLQEPQPKEFWNKHLEEMEAPKGFFSAQFKDLIKKLLREDPAQRLTLE